MRITEKCMLVDLSVSVWSARKTDKKVTLEVVREHGASDGAGRFHKALLAREALAAVTKAASKAREAHYSLTLPWTDAGARILPAEMYLDYVERLRGLRATFDAAVSDFLAAYPALVQEARTSLGTLWSEAEYPAPGAMARKFAIDFHVFPLPAGEDFRVSVGAAEEAAIRADIEARTAAAVQAASRDVYTRIVLAVGAMSEKLAGYSENPDGTKSGVFRDSLVENVRALAEVLPRLNITGDPILATAAADISAKLCRWDADDLRRDDLLRHAVANDAQGILDAMAGYCGDVDFDGAAVAAE